MKKLTSLTLAVVSTMFLAVGATHAAEKFDALSQSTITTGATHDEQMPILPCGIDERSDS
jgi:hypothetical protein